MRSTIPFLIITAIGFGVVCAYVSYNVAITNLDLVNITNKVDNAVQVANKAESVTAQLDTKQVQAVVKVEVDEAVLKIKSSETRQLSQAVSSIIANAETISAVRDPEIMKAIATVSEHKEALVQTAGIVDKVASATSTKNAEEIVTKSGLLDLENRLKLQLDEIDKKSKDLDTLIASEVKKLQDRASALDTLIAQRADASFVNSLSSSINLNIGKVATLEGKVTTLEKGLPVGTILAYVGTTVPVDWKVADGTAYGADCVLVGDTPNLVDRYLKGATIAGTLGDWKTGKPQNLSVDTAISSDGFHKHDILIAQQGGTLGQGVLLDDNNANYFSYSLNLNDFIKLSGQHSHSAVSTITGFDTVTEPKNYTVRFIIKCR